MAVTIAIETPLQDDVRGLVAKLNDHLLPLSPIEFQFKMTVEQMAEAHTTLFVARDDDGRAVGMRWRSPPKDFSTPARGTAASRKLRG